MPRWKIVALTVGVLVTSGCLRTRIDLCSQVPPHEECAFLDAGRDVGDAPTDGAVDAADGGTDAPTEDALTDAGVDDAP